MSGTPIQIISVTTQVAISRKVHRCRLALRDCQAARGREEELEDCGQWPGVGMLMRIRVD